MCGEQYVGSTKTNFRSRVNIYKSMKQKFMNTEVVPKIVLKQRRFYEHCCSDRHNAIEYWVVTLTYSVDTLK